MNSEVYNVPSSPSILVYFRASRFFKEQSGRMKSTVKPTITLERLEMLGLSPKDANICEKESPARRSEDKHTVHRVTVDYTF